MIIEITFPDGKKKDFRVNVEYGCTIEDIAEEIAKQMVQDYSKIRNIKNEKKYIESIKRWLIPHLYTNVLEAFESAKKK